MSFDSRKQIKGVKEKEEQGAVVEISFLSISHVLSNSRPEQHITHGMATLGLKWIVAA